MHRASSYHVKLFFLHFFFPFSVSRPSPQYQRGGARKDPPRRSEPSKPSQRGAGRDRGGRAGPSRGGRGDPRGRQGGGSKDRGEKRGGGKSDGVIGIGE